MGTPNDQTEVRRTLILVAGVAVLILGVDPLILWVFLYYIPPTSPLPFWLVYIGWGTVWSFIITFGLLRELLRDKDKTQPPPTPIRRVGRIT